MDAHVAPTAHKIGPYQLHALVEKAIADHMPDLAEERRLAKADGRYFTIEQQENSFDGTASVHGAARPRRRPRPREAVADVAAQLKDLGSEESLDVRRAMAVGELARCQPTFDLDPTSVEPVETPRRQVVLYVHLTDAALQGAAGTARLERGNAQVTAGQVRDWCGTAGSVVVKPVIDLDTHDPVESPVVPDRHAEIVTLRDKTCVFPWCTRPARRCDKDHSIPHSRGGPTCPCNLAPLCRRHHRIKTHGALVVPLDRARHLPVDVEARVPVPPRHHRHPRRQPRSAPATRLATPPHTPPTGGAIPMPGHRVCAFRPQPQRSTRADREPTSSASSAATDAASNHVTRKNR